MTEEDVLITAQLWQRSRKPVDFETENRILRDLARRLTQPIEIFLKHFIKIAQELCQAGTAGISLIEATSGGEEVLRWVALSGSYEKFEGGTISRDNSPCGVCLKKGNAELFSYPARYFQPLQGVEPQIVEAMVVPFMLEEKTLGTIWVVSHDQPQQFDQEDLRVISSLAEFLVAALANAQMRQEIEESSRREKAARELNLLNQSLIKTSELLAERNLELESFTHIVSHDLKAPLRAIANLSQWLQEDLEGQINENAQNQIQLLQNRVARMEAMIDGLLVYSRVGRIKLKPELVDVNILLQEILDSLAPPSTFTITIKSPLPTIFTRRLLLFQVFSNLISNAIKHHPCPDGKIEISVKPSEQFYQFAIADNGQGIPPEFHDKIFGIFKTLQSRDVKESTGIGLSIVKKIVETEGGKITLESDLGRGATFCFTWLKQPTPSRA